LSRLPLGVLRSDPELECPEIEREKMIENQRNSKKSRAINSQFSAES